MVRQPTVAGQFYPGSAGRLMGDVARMTKAEAPPGPAIGVVAPHAGYVYSGSVAGSVYARVQVPGTVVVLGPNHTGLGGAIALWTGGAWAVPGAEVPIDRPMALALAEAHPDAREDESAHRFEHSIEVQVPFLLHRNPAVSIVPVCLGRLSLRECLTLGEALARTIRDAGRETLIVASSDMTHYEEDGKARAKDRLAIDRMLALDPEGLYRTVAKHDISMCGVIPATVMLCAATGLGAVSAELAAYATSGEVSGDDDQVVGYAGIVVR